MDYLLAIMSKRKWMRMNDLYDKMSILTRNALQTVKHNMLCFHDALSIDFCICS